MNQSSDNTGYQMISDIDTDRDIHTDTDRDTDRDIPINRDIEISNQSESVIGVATATLNIGTPSSSFTPISTEDDQPLQMVSSLSDEVFKGANIRKSIVTEIISYFCDEYKDRIHKPCPHISEEFANKIPELIVVLTDPDSGEILIDETMWMDSPTDCRNWYLDMIDKYFSTEFSEGCNYSLQHFFSGNIRSLRYYELSRNIGYY